MNKVKYIILLVMLLVAVSGCTRSESDVQATEDSEESVSIKIIEDKELPATTAEHQEYTEFTDFYLVDYKVLVGLLERRGSMPLGSYVFDTDGDGIEELFVMQDATEDETTVTKHVFYAMSHGENPAFGLCMDSGTDEEGHLYIDEATQQIYLRQFYWTMGYASKSYYIWQNGWQEYAMATYRRIGDSMQPQSLVWEGQEVSEDVWEQNDNAILESTQILDYSANIDNISISNGDFEQICKDYAMHLDTHATHYETILEDIDGDGDLEAVYAIEDYAGLWRSRVTSREELTDEYGLVNNEDNYVSIIVIDQKDTEIDFLIGYAPEVSTFQTLVYKDNLEILVSDEVACAYNITDNPMDYVQYVGVDTGELRTILLSHTFYWATSEAQDIMLLECTFTPDGIVRLDEMGTEVQGSYTVNEEDHTVTVQIGNKTSIYRYVDELQGFGTEVEMREFEQPDGSVGVKESFEVLAPRDSIGDEFELVEWMETYRSGEF